MSYRIAKSLDKLRSQANAFAPQRSRASDGWVGDAAHAATNSDHNPWVKDGATGVVTAFDITHDPKGGMDAYALAERMRESCDPRIKYVITNKRIFSSTTQPWVWRAYAGSNPHTTHMHISVNSDKAHYDNEALWSALATTTAPPLQVSPPPSSDAYIGATLRKGSKGDDVRLAQQKLFVDGDFGQLTEDAVKRFQKKEGLTADGVVGRLTWEKLDRIK